MTNVRKWVNNTTDEKLAEIIAEYSYNSGFCEVCSHCNEKKCNEKRTCREVVKEFALKEVEE